MMRPFFQLGCFFSATTSTTKTTATTAATTASSGTTTTKTAATDGPTKPIKKRILSRKKVVLIFFPPKLEAQNRAGGVPAPAAWADVAYVNVPSWAEASWYQERHKKAFFVSSGETQLHRGSRQSSEPGWMFQWGLASDDAMISSLNG
jgi:hypothetical protein